MDISIIQADKVTLGTGIKVGSDNAPKKIIEFINLRCPYCKQWLEESAETLEAAVAANHVQRIIKLYDKEKPSLQPGNIMHHHISFTDGAAAYQTIKEIAASQSDWGSLSLEGVAEYAVDKLHLTLQPQQKEQYEAIAEEAAAASIQFVPTIILGTHIFDEAITQDELSALLAE